MEILPESSEASATGEVLALLTAADFDLRTVTDEPWQLGQPLPENNLWAVRNGAPASG